MAVEAKRGCGSRKIGGLYLVGEGLSAPCMKMPANAEVCPVCGEGFRFFRGWRWIDAIHFFGGDCVKSKIVTIYPDWCKGRSCPFNSDKVGLMWVGERFYKPEQFIEEAQKMGISKRIGAVPKDFVLGESWVLLAHKKAGRKKTWRDARPDEVLPLEIDFVRNVDGINQVAEMVECPAVFIAFRPTRIEKIMTQKMVDELPPERKERDAKQRIDYVIVPEDDADHQGTVYDKPEEEGEEADAGPADGPAPEPKG